MAKSIYSLLTKTSTLMWFRRIFAHIYAHYKIHVLVCTCIFACDACMNQCVCVYKKYVLHIFAASFLHMVCILFNFVFSLNPLPAFSISAGYDIHIFVFRCPMTSTERCMQSTKCISGKKEKKKNKNTKANCLHHLSTHLSQTVPGNQSENHTTTHRFVIQKCHKARSGISQASDFPSGAMHTHTCAHSWKCISKCQLIP